MFPALTSPEEFLAVRHSVLNGNTYDVDRLVEDTLRLRQYAPGRIVIPCFEGDLLQVRETGEIVLTHQHFFPLSQNHYRDLKERKLAASLNEVLDKVAGYKQRSPEQKVVLCFEPKLITDPRTIDETVHRLKEYGLKDVYFDSFFGEKLDMVEAANKKHGTNYARSFHIVGNIGKT